MHVRINRCQNRAILRVRAEEDAQQTNFWKIRGGGRRKKRLARVSALPSLMAAFIVPLPFFSPFSCQLASQPARAVYREEGRKEGTREEKKAKEQDDDYGDMEVTTAEK